MDVSLWVRLTATAQEGAAHRVLIEPSVSGRGSRAQQTGSIFHGIRAVHATGRSAHRHQHG
jgi:hypothetical protein